MRTIGIKEKRKTAGLSQKELAERLGVDQSAVAHWERGVSGPKRARLAEVANALGCSVAELLEPDADSVSDEQSDKQDG